MANCDVAGTYSEDLYIQKYTYTYIYIYIHIYSENLYSEISIQGIYSEVFICSKIYILTYTQTYSEI